LPSEGVAHEHQVDLVVALFLDRIDPVDSGDQGFRVLFQVLVVIRQDLLHELLFAIRHCLYDKAPVMTEEEEAPTCS